MKKKTDTRELHDELQSEYDLSKLKGGTRGKYIARYRAGTNLILLHLTSPLIFLTSNPSILSCAA